ncbi:RlmE family RNA methyltransferase [Candidatus Anaplasma sp. TIGMIC]|uniref:RlmE family RNA methyltransferase n=1 Tax=Candidatus Anaplasma sp. TIGMIC TaxID=3020713 RepID=UPI003977871B
MRRQINDQYVALAKKHGYRSRSAYKLIEIHEKFKIFQRGMHVLDLGSYPGGWAQVASELVSDNSKSMVVALDIQLMEGLPNVEFVQCDIEKDTDVLDGLLRNKRFDVVLSDMAPRSCGHRQVDHANIINLSEMARDVALKYLNLSGSFITKILQGEYEAEFKMSLMAHFESVTYFKPKASRNDSSEVYLIALRLKGGEHHLE